MGLLDFATAQPSGGGLLDFAFSDPGARLGMSLLAASSPKLRPLGQAMAQQDAAKQQALQAQYIQSQIAENTSQADMRKQQLAMAQQKQNMLAGLFGGNAGGSPLAGVTTGGGINMPAPAGGGGGIENLTLSQVAALKANGIDVADLWKFGKEGIKREAGNYYQDLNGNTQYLPKLDPGMAVSGGQVMAAPGYAQANSMIKGSEAGAVEAAKFPYAVGQDAARQRLGASLDPVKTYNSQTGREEYVPRAAVVQPQYSGAGYAGGSAAAAAPEQLQIMQSELNKLPPDHPDRPAIMREMQRLGGGQVAQSGNYAAGPSAMETAANEAARARAVDTAKADVVRDTGRQAEGKLATKLTSGIDRAIELLQQGPTSSAVGTLADKAMGLVGTSTKSGELAAQLGTLSGWLVSNVPRMEGPQSNIDVQNYQTMAGRVGESSLPIGMRLAAAQEVKRLQQKYMHLNGGEAGGEQPQQAQQPAQREFSMLPKATEFDGKRMRGPDGTVYRSAGGKWVKE